MKPIKKSLRINAITIYYLIKKMSYQSIIRRIRYNLAVFPVLGRNAYERLNSRLDRQIEIRKEKRLGIKNVRKSRLLFPNQNYTSDSKKLFFDTV